MWSLFISFFSGLLFSIGLALSGMVDPMKVKNFLNITGAWDPSLLFVMGGALMVNFVSFHFILKKKKPIFDQCFHIPNKKQLDLSLILGAAIFGIGWGLVGICPGAALASILHQQSEMWLFFISMILGMLVYEATQVKRS